MRICHEVYAVYRSDVSEYLDNADGESMRVSHRATGETSSGELSRQGNGIGSSWILSGSGAPSTGILLVVATLITLAGGLVAQGPLKPIVISKAPPCVIWSSLYPSPCGIISECMYLLQSDRRVPRV